MKIACLSDITLGYAVPQIELLTASLARHYAATEAVVVEPDMKGRRALFAHDLISLRRFVTRTPPHDPVFHIEYARFIERFLRSFRPDVLIVTNGAVMPGLLLSGHKPALLIYYMLESLEHQIHGGSLYGDFNDMVQDMVDIVAVPEQRRAAYDLRTPEWTSKPLVELLNVASDQGFPPRQALAADGPVRFLHAGTINRNTFCDVLSGLKMDNIRIDMAGPQDDDATRSIVRKGSESGNVTYLGLLPLSRLHGIVQDYDYRFVLWRPLDFNSFFASPNKLFESISAGVPPICTPNPQCADIIRRYDCGILMEGWENRHLEAAIRYAISIARTERYLELVRNCYEAVRCELNWSAQFDKMIPHLPAASALQRETAVCLPA
ncbi:hypothetical protein [Azospirillum palustre]